MKCATVIIVMCLFMLCQCSATAKLPNFVQTCTISPDVSLCFKSVMESLRPFLAKGIPEMKIPPITPLILPRVALSQENSSSINFRSTLKNFKIDGLENFDIQKVAVDLNEPFLSWKMRFPKMHLHSDFTAKGKLLIINFDGDGILDNKLDDVTIQAEWTGKKITKNGKEHIVFRLAEQTCKITGAMKASIRNLFKGNPELDENFNRIIQENSEVLKPEIEPVLGKLITDVTTQLLNAVFDLYGLDQLFPPN